MPSGSKPGERRGGIKKGGLHKKTEARIKAAEGRAIAAHRSGLGMVDVIKEAALFIRAMAVKLQRRQQETPEADRDEKAVAALLERAANLALKAAPFETPRLSTLTLREAPPDLSALSDEELAQLEHLIERTAVARLSTTGAGATAGPGGTRRDN